MHNFDELVAKELQEMTRVGALSIAIGLLAGDVGALRKRHSKNSDLRAAAHYEAVRRLLIVIRDQVRCAERNRVGGTDQIARAAARVLEVVGYIAGSEYAIMISDTKKLALALRELNNALDNLVTSREGNHANINEANVPLV